MKAKVLNMTKVKIMNAMNNASIQSTIDNLDNAAELLYIEGILSDDDYDEIHSFWKTHWFNDMSGKVESLD